MQIISMHTTKTHGIYQEFKKQVKDFALLVNTYEAYISILALLPLITLALISGSLAGENFYLIISY